MKKRILAIIMMLMLCLGYITPSTPAQETGSAPTLRTTISKNTSNVDLTLGKAEVLHFNQPTSRVSVSDPNVVGLVVLSPTEIQLIGKSVGVANLLIWSNETGSNYLTIDISVNRDVSTLARKMKMIDPGINIIPVQAENSVILTGFAESHEKAQLAFDMAKAFFESDAQTVGGGADAVGAPTGGGGGGAGGAMASSNSAGTASLAGSSTKIINLIRVQGEPSTKAEMVQARLKSIDPNIQMTVVPGSGNTEKVVLRGRVKNTSVVAKAVNLASIFYGQPGLQILSGQGGNLISKEDDSNNSSFASGFKSDQSAGLVGNLSRNILNGSIITDTSGNVISLMEVEERPQVRCQIKIMEVRKDNNLNFTGNLFLDTNHVKATSFLGANAAVGPVALKNSITGATGSAVGIVFGNEVGAFFQGLVTQGKARILAEPSITSISGEPGVFLAGGEFPIPVIGSNGQITIIFKQFGVRLTVIPTVTERGTIHMQVTPEVSTLDPTAGITLSGITVPGLRSRRSQTVVEMRDGENFVMSGLYNEDMQNTLSQTPILGQIPILGVLFRSRAFRRAETELVITIRPEIINDMNMSNLETPTNIRQISDGTNGGTDGTTAASTPVASQPIDPQALKALYGQTPAPAEAAPVAAEKPAGDINKSLQQTVKNLMKAQDPKPAVESQAFPTENRIEPIRRSSIEPQKAPIHAAAKIKAPQDPKSTESSDKPEKAQKHERATKSEKAAKADKSVKADKTAKADKKAEPIVDKAPAVTEKADQNYLSKQKGELDSLLADLEKKAPVAEERPVEIKHPPVQKAPEQAPPQVAPEKSSEKPVDKAPVAEKSSVVPIKKSHSVATVATAIPAAAPKAEIKPALITLPAGPKKAVRTTRPVPVAALHQDLQQSVSGQFKSFQNKLGKVFNWNGQ